MSTAKLQLSTVPPVATAMRIRRPPAEVFRAFVDPAVTTRFWFTRSSGPLAPGATVRWEWEMYGVGTDVTVVAFEPDRRLVFTWNGDEPATVEMRFTPMPEDSTFLEITETGYAAATGDDVVAHIGESTGGFTIVACAVKALLEQDVELGAVADRHPR